MSRLSRIIVRRSLALVACGALATAALATMQPARANAFVARLNSLVTCATTTACVVGANTANGIGVSGTDSGSGIGVSGTSVNGFGMVASSTNLSAIYASSVKSNGIFASSQNGHGVSGRSANSYGVYGGSGGTGSNAAGVWGNGPFVGVLGSTSNNGFGVKGLTASGEGVWGLASSGGIGTGGESMAGDGVYANSLTGTGLYAYSALGTGLRSDIHSTGFSVVGTSVDGTGNGADFEGGRFGIIGRAHASGFPLVLTDSGYNNLFYVNGVGDIYYSGNFISFVRTTNGAAVSSFTAKSTEPTVEDTGSAHLVAGVVTVALDHSFAAAIDAATPYRVFITPGGETRGLFVAQKTSHGFVVREMQAGRSNVAFDYRIVATTRGGAGKHMTLTHVADVPHAPGAAPHDLASDVRKAALR